MNLKSFSYQGVLKELVALVLINTIIALLLLGIGFAERLGDSFIYSQLIGFCIFTSVRSCYVIFKNLRPVIQLFIIFLALALGALCGMGLANIMLADGPLMFDVWLGRFNLQVLFVSLLCGTVVSYLFISQKKIQEINAIAQEEKIRRLDQEKQAVEMELKFLQAQVEPHFLFNTLSNIHTLLSSDSVAASKMLLNLTDYLRTSLLLSRKEKITVKDELKMLSDYLEIFKIRMGPRLKYEIEVEEKAAGMAIPPMLIQPLVENCIKHGLEPSVEGGKIFIAVTLRESMLNVEIADTGKGITEERSPGVGTTSVCDRIQSIYGENKAKIHFEEKYPRGLKVRMVLPPI